MMFQLVGDHRAVARENKPSASKRVCIENLISPSEAGANEGWCRRFRLAMLYRSCSTWPRASEPV